jgi:4'-phosphopantetheinyl transferase EntD
MGVILKKDIDDGVKLGIWEITEEFPELRSKLSLETEEVRTLEGYRNVSRQLEWLSVRTLVNELTGANTRIVYTEDRKPYLLDNSSHISISHSKDFTAILMSKFKRVGVDVEHMSQRITNISDKFINDSEVITENIDLSTYHLYILWSAKEALYKICDKKFINLKENIRIQAFQPESEGRFKGTVDNIQGGVDTYELFYKRMDDYIIVWTYK